MEVKMIDVSVHNGVIDWDKVKASGIGGVLMRCGYGSDIESQDDKMFKRNADECSRLGIPFGVYLYSYAKNTDMAKSEADHALRLVKGYKLSYPLYIDVEEASQSGIAKDVVKVFCEAVKAAGYMPGVYANENWCNQQANDGDRNRNHVNYGSASAIARIMTDFGHNVDIPVWDDNGFLRIPKIVIDGEVFIDFEKSE